MRLLVAVIALLTVGCAVPPPPARAVDLEITTAPIVVERKFETTVHVDSRWTTPFRAIIREAASKWHRATQDRVRIEIAFDLEFSNPANVEGHRALGHVMGMWTSEDSAVVEDLDKRLGGRVIAANLHLQSGATLLAFVPERIESSHLEAVVTHEIGHLIGLPDLPSVGSIMSGSEDADAPVPSELTVEDLNLCRAYRLCE